MRAMAMASWKQGTPLALIEMPSPSLRAGEVRVAVHAIGVNPVDWKLRDGGLMRPLARLVRFVRGPRGPIVLGVDFAGVVAEVGAGVAGVAVGQRVVGGTDFSRGQHGSYADEVVVRADQLCALPDAVALDVAAGLPVAGVTAWMAVVDYGRIGAGKRALVLGASGGVGQFAVQIAKRVRGAERVIGVCSSGNAELVRGLGADAVIDYKDGDALAQAKAHGPFDVIVDCVGGYGGAACRSLLGPGGRHVMVAGDSPAAMAQVVVPPFTSRAILGAPTGERLGPVVDAVARGQITVAIARRLPLAEAEEAHRLSRSGRMTGKLLLLPRPS